MAGFLLVWGCAALAQDQLAQMDVIQVMESEEHGPYLADGDGRSLYLFVTDASALAGMDAEPVRDGVRSEAAACTGGCLDNWPPLLADLGGTDGAAPAEGDTGQVVADWLYSAEIDGREQVVYNGWPLYYFANDAAAGETNGQGAGGRWFLVSPDGAPIGAASDGASDDTSPDGADDGEMGDDDGGNGGSDDAGDDGDTDEGSGD